jgi:hypothetical protein
MGNYLMGHDIQFCAEDTGRRWAESAKRADQCDYAASGSVTVPPHY